MNVINAPLNWLADLLLAPFAAAPLAGLLFWSAVAGVAMTYVFGKTSKQKSIRRAADRVRAQMLAVKLFKDDLSVTLQCQVELMKATGARLWHSVPPMLVMIVPFALILSQLALRYDRRPLQPGEDTVVAMRLAPEVWEEFQNVELEVIKGVVVETDSLRDQDAMSLYWRVRAEGDQSVTLRWQFGDEAIEKELAIAADTGRLSHVSVRRPGPEMFARLLHPGEPGFDRASPVQDITVQYPLRTTPIFGVDVPWWATFLIVSMAVALLVRRFLRVEF